MDESSLRLFRLTTSSTRIMNNKQIVGPCHIWPRKPTYGGYGQFGWRSNGQSHTVLIHRLVWKLVHGHIPIGMTIDHMCLNKMCINIMHLRLLTNVENAKDNGNARKTHCPRDHEYDEFNTFINKKNHRECRICRYENRKKEK